MEVRLPTGHGTYTLSSLGGGPIKEANWLVLRSSGDGFPSKEEADFAGLNAKNGIRWCSARMRVGVDLGDDRTHGGASDYLKRKILEERGIRMLNEPHGLMVYEDDAEHPTRFFSASGEPQVGRSVAAFEEQLLEALDRNLRLSDKETLAFELYGLSHFEAAPRARFLTLVSAIETVMEDRPRSPEAVEHVERLMRCTQDSQLPRSEIDSILGSLSWLRRESISRAGKMFVDEMLGRQEYGGKIAREFFQYCYNLRSELMHSGKPSDDADLGQLVVRLDQLVADLLVARIYYTQS